MPATATYQDTHSKRQTYETIRSQLWSDRSTFDQHWRDLGNYIYPRRTRFQVTDKNKGDRRNQNILDSTATFAARSLRSGLHAGISSPARPWMRLTTPDPDLAEYGPVKEWLHTVTQRMLTVFLRSNLYNGLPILYGDMGVFGTACMACIEDDHDLMRVYCYPIGSYLLGMSERQVVDIVVREYLMTVRQIVTSFGLEPNGDIDWTNISNTVKGLWDRGDTEQNVEVCWVVMPNPDRDDNRLEAKYLPYTSCHFEKGQDKDDRFLRESGFREFPILAPRWDVTGEDTYGTDCPGMTALGDIRGLQTMIRRKAQAIEKQLNPPLQAPTHIRNQKASLLPGDVTYVDVREGQLGVRPIHEIQPAIADITADINETRFMIRRAFYEDLFLMLAQTDRRQITAREIEERHEEKLLALGPVLERTNDELLDPLIDRVYAMMDQAGMIPPPPNELEGVSLKVEYISLMAQAQKLIGAAGLDRFLGTVVPIQPVFPQITHKINIFQVIDDMADIYGLNPKIVVPDEEAAEALETERQGAAAAAQMAAMGSMAGSAKDLSGADLSTDNALTRMLEGGGAPAV